LKVRKTEDNRTVEYHIFGMSRQSTVRKKSLQADHAKAAATRQESPSWKKAASAEKSAAPDSGCRKASKA